ncbi:MAG: hypothetical protein Ta2G_16970 [Termitinemataceae bacterium]|nr:MAG: hypothetical protein Ta2G_16970 [Termitinemataceae bacterium]
MKNICKSGTIAMFSMLLVTSFLLVGCIETDEGETVIDTQAYSSIILENLKAKSDNKQGDKFVFDAVLVVDYENLLGFSAVNPENGESTLMLTVKTTNIAPNLYQTYRVYVECYDPTSIVPFAIKKVAKM